MYRSYFQLPRDLLYFIVAEFFIQLINTSFFHVLLVYMENKGYTDYESAGFVSLRFVGVLAMAIPLGYLIRGRKIRPFLLISSIGVPLLTLLVVYAIAMRFDMLLTFAMGFWGVAFLLLQVCALPYILRNAPEGKQTEAIALSFATYSLGGITSGVLISGFKNILPASIHEGYILAGLAILALAGVFFLLRIREPEVVPVSGSDRESNRYDWNVIFRALIPTIIISTGAGLTIPFISIFFYNVHGLGSETFPFFGAIASLLVAVAALLVPQIKRKFTYKLAIPVTQSIAVVALIFLATTQFYSHMSIGVVVALGCYLIRQPLMNIAGPMTSEIVMGYVGEKNREMMSALTSATWSGSWFLSSWIFKALRENNLEYAYVFLITAALYGTGVVLYVFLIRAYEKKQAQYSE